MPARSAAPAAPKEVSIITSLPTRPSAETARPVTAASARTSGSASAIVRLTGLVSPSRAQRGPGRTLPSTRTSQPSGSQALIVRETIVMWTPVRRASSVTVIGPLRPTSSIRSRPRSSVFDIRPQPRGLR